MKFDDLLVGFVVSIVIFFNTISTTMLNKGFCMLVRAPS